MTDHRPVASDQAARERAIEADGSVLVQAPAGSGKTTLLVQRYLRLLALVDAPERILALTFTRRAGRGNARTRAAGVGRRAARTLSAEHEPRDVELAAAASRHLDASNLDIERQPSRLRIETIDAFNAWLASSAAHFRGAGSARQVLADAAPCYEEAARRALATRGGR